MSMQKEFETTTGTGASASSAAAAAPKLLAVNDVKSKLHDIEKVAAKITSKHDAEIKFARKSLGSVIVQDFVKDLVSILTNFKKAIPIYASKFDWVLTRISSYSIDANNTGGIEQKILEFHDLIMANDRKKRLKKHDLTALAELYAKEKAFAKSLDGFDIDFVLSGLPTASKKNVCEYVLRLFRHARKLKDMDKHISSGAWNEQIVKVGNDLSQQLAGLKSDDISEDQLIQLVMSRVRQMQAPNAPPPNPAMLKQMMASFSSFGLAPTDGDARLLEKMFGAAAAPDGSTCCPRPYPATMEEARALHAELAAQAKPSPKPAETPEAKGPEGPAKAPAPEAPPEKK